MDTQTKAGILIGTYIGGMALAEALHQHLPPEIHGHCLFYAPAGQTMVMTTASATALSRSTMTSL